MDENKMISVEILGEKKSYPAGTTYAEIAREYDKGEREILLVMAGARLRELHHKAKEGDVLRFVTINEKIGEKTYQRSLELLMLCAIWHVCKGDERYKTTVHFVVSDGLYCTLQDPSVLSEEFLVSVENEMHRLVSRDLPIIKRNVSTNRAREMFRESGMQDKEKLFRYRLSSRTNIYELDGYVDYYYGFMAHSTGFLDKFDLRLWKDGFVLSFPTKEDPDELPPFDPEEKLFAVQKDSLEWGNMLGISTVADLNDLIVRGKMKELILTQEAYHEKQVAQIARDIASDPKKKIVMIAGPSSSSKTTFSHRLSTQLSVYGVVPHPIPVDDYFVDREKTPKDENGNYNFECLEALDIEQFNKDMTALLRGERVELPTFNFKTGKREYKGKFEQLGPNDILVIEGIHCLNDKLSYALPRESKYKVYISALTQLNVDEHNRIATTDGRLIRRMVRDARTRGTSAAGTISMWPSVRRGEEEHIFPFQGSADVMFNSALIYELAVLKIFAEPLLFGIDENSPDYAEAKRLLKFLDYFVPMNSEDIPKNSLIREFIGGSCFDV